MDCCFESPDFLPPVSNSASFLVTSYPTTIRPRRRRKLRHSNSLPEARKASGAMMDVDEGALAGQYQLLEELGSMFSSWYEESQTNGL